MVGIARLTQGLEALACAVSGDHRNTRFPNDVVMGPDVAVFTPVEAVESQKEAILYRRYGSGHPFLRPAQILRQSGVDMTCVIDDPFDDRMTRIIQHRDRP